ncbi:MAG TPA: hypothetical protein VFT45_04145 [Longimicrobium sp.]|nr:hypothetical protein [Longimicrobium sp.]
MSTRKRPEQDSVEQLVRKALGKAGEDLSPRELKELVREFVKAGSDAVRMERVSTPREAARLMAGARERLTRARQRAGEVSEEKRTPGIIIPPQWRAAEQAMEAHEAALLREEGVVGVGISYRRRAGVPVPERCVVVLVQKKLSPDQLGDRRRAIPAALEVDGVMVPTDIVEMGKFQLKAGPGSVISPDGTTMRGTLGCFAEDRDGGGPVALTSMHLLKGNPSEFPGIPPSTKVLRFSSGSQPVGRLLFGTRTRVDAAKISVDSGSVTRVIPEIGTLRGARPIDVEADANIGVRMFGAASKLLHGTITIPLAKVTEFPALGRCIITNIPAIHGDSGALLVDGAEMGLGLLVGGGDVLNAFTPMSAVLSEVRARIRSIP